MKWLKKLFFSNPSITAKNGSVAINGDNKAPIIINNGEYFNIKDFPTWSKTSDFSAYPFIDIDVRKQIISTLRELLKQPRQCARIIGLSGLGKTRTAFEVFRGYESLKDIVYYIDISVTPNIAVLLSDWIKTGLRRIIVVDNCDANIHKQIQKEISRTDSQLSLLTLDYNLERISNTQEVELKPFTTSKIQEMLASIYGKKIPDLERIAEFAQGFPQMAVLIAKARLNNATNIGSLTDDDIAKKLLWGKSQQANKQDETILKACALFNTFGMDENVANQYQFIANYNGINEDDFYDCIQRFTERGIIDRRGRYAQLVPKPLAIRLASQWWKRTHPDKQKALINNLPESLIESFCEQTEKLDFLPEVKTLTESICGCQSPFGQAEVILSNRGSRLFRSLVNVNPKATTNALFRILNHQSYEQLLNINGDVRRNLVWALEKLCFHADIFENAAWCLLLLASAENESWSNNATGQFKQLFNIYNSGTATTLEQRINIIKRAIEHDDIYFTQVVLQALNAATDTCGTMRTIGAEYQGTKPPLQEWQPKFWQEIFDYWQSCFNLLIILVKHDNSNISEQAKNIIGHSIRGLIHYGRIEMLDNAINQVISLKGRYWYSALDSIKTTLEFDTKEMPKEGIDSLYRWLALLTPEQTNIEEQLKILVINPPWENRQAEDGSYIDVAAENAEKLANQLSSNIKQLNPYLSLLLQGEQRKSFWFARTLAIKSDDIDEFIKNTIAIISTLEQENTDFLRGLLAGIYQKSIAKWNDYVTVFFNDKNLNKFYAEIICTGRIETIHLHNLLNLIKNNQLLPNNALILSYGSVTSHLNSSDIAIFCLDLSKINSNSAWVALDILFMYCHGDDNKFNAVKDTLKIIVTSVKLNEHFRGGHSDMYQWQSTVDSLLEIEGLEFAHSICQQIITAVDDKLNYGDVQHYIKPMLFKIMTDYGKELWSLFGEEIINVNSIKRYELKSLIGRDIGFGGNKSENNIFSVLPLKLVIDWCNENKKIAPYFIARSINIFEQIDNQKQPSQLFIALLENFGDLESLGSELSANLNTRGWSGSLVPYLKSDKAAFTPLLNHPNYHVRHWVENYISNLDKQIAHESKRDEEDNLGIY